MEFRHLEGVPQPDPLRDFTITMVIQPRIPVSWEPILQVGKGGWMVNKNMYETKIFKVGCLLVGNLYHGKVGVAPNIYVYIL